MDRAAPESRPAEGSQFWKRAKHRDKEYWRLWVPPINRPAAYTEAARVRLEKFREEVWTRRYEEVEANPEVSAGTSCSS